MTLLPLTAFQANYNQAMSNLIDILRFQQNRRNQYDVTNRVRIDSHEAVCRAVSRVFKATYKEDAPDLLETVFTDFIDLYEGRYPGYHCCDTLYHDIQHSLDAALAMARLVSGYEQQNPNHLLGQQRFIIGIITALFHDSGYIRRKELDTAINGAVYTYQHIERGASFLEQYLLQHQLVEYTELATKIIHFTGFEVSLDALVFTDAMDHRLGQLLGTADLIAQLSDRCYLEKCRDRLYPELVLANMLPQEPCKDRYQPDSAIQLLQQTQDFYRNTVLRRLEFDFDGSHRFAISYFNGRNYYMECIDQNLVYLESIIMSNDFSKLNRRPPMTAGSNHFPYFLVELKGSTHPLLWSKKQ